MKINQTYRVCVSTPTIYALKCVNADCPFRLRAMVGKKSYKWFVTRWGGRHTCVNQLLTQDHPKCDSEFISSCIVGTFLIYGLILICIICVRYNGYSLFYFNVVGMVREEPSISIALIQERIIGIVG